MLIYIKGEDSYLAKRAIELIRSKHKLKHGANHQINIYPPEQVINWADLSSASLFQESRLVVIYGGGEYPDVIQDELAAFLARKDEKTIVVFWDGASSMLTNKLEEVLQSSPKIIDASVSGVDHLLRHSEAIAKRHGLAMRKDEIKEIVAGAESLWFAETHLAARALGYKEPLNNQEENEKFAYFNAARNKDIKGLVECVRRDTNNAVPFELIIGTLASALRKYYEPKERLPLVSELLSIDIAVKTGLVDLPYATSLIIISLKRSGSTELSKERVSWSKEWEEVV